MTQICARKKQNEVGLLRLIARALLDGAEDCPSRIICLSIGRNPSFRSLPKLQTMLDGNVFVVLHSIFVEYVCELERK